MATSGMVTFLPPSPGVVENSVFGVLKEPHVSQILIWGKDRSILLFNPEASSVALPSPDLLCSLRLPPGSRLYLSGCDISQYYNRLRAPDFLVPFLGMPRVRSAALGLSPPHEVLVPCLRCIPMGASFAVNLAQRATLAILQRSGVCKSLVERGAARQLRGGMGTQVPYIDDCNSVGTSASGVNEATRRIMATLEKHGLPVTPKKTQWADDTSPACALGLWWWQSGILSPRPAMVRRLRRETERILLRKGGTLGEVWSLICVWVWC